MSNTDNSSIGALVGALEDAAAEAAERRRAALEAHSLVEKGRAEYQEQIDELCSRPSPLVNGVGAEQRNARSRQKFDPGATTKQIDAEVDRRVRWETSLCNAEDALLRLWGVSEARPVVEQIAALIRSSRLTTAAGPEPVSTDTRKEMGDYLKSEVAWSRGRLKEMESLSPDSTEEEVAPSVREGMQRTVGFMDRLHVYLGAQQQATDRWEAARTRPIEEALVLARVLARTVAGQ